MVAALVQPSMKVLIAVTLLDAVEVVAADGPSADPEENIDEVEPGPPGRAEVQHDPVLATPLDVLVLVGVVVVQDHVQLPARVSPGDLLEEVEELGLTVPVVALVGHRTGGYLESGEQRGGAIALVVVGRLLRQAWSQRQDALSSTIGTSHPRTTTAFIQWVQVLPDHVADSWPPPPGLWRT